MTLSQFRNESRLNDGINFSPVDYRFCNNYPNQCVCDTDGCSARLEDFETLVVNNEKFVDFDWKVNSQELPPVSSAGLNDPAWTHCNN
jgi:hypothetical protein